MLYITRLDHSHPLPTGQHTHIETLVEGEPVYRPRALPTWLAPCSRFLDSRCDVTARAKVDVALAQATRRHAPAFLVEYAPLVGDDTWASSRLQLVCEWLCALNAPVVVALRRVPDRSAWNAIFGRVAYSYPGVEPAPVAPQPVLQTMSLATRPMLLLCVTPGDEALTRALSPNASSPDDLAAFAAAATLAGVNVVLRFDPMIPEINTSREHTAPWRDALTRALGPAAADLPIQRVPLTLRDRWRETWGARLDDALRERIAHAVLAPLTFSMPGIELPSLTPFRYMSQRIARPAEYTAAMTPDFPPATSLPPS